MTDSVRTIDAEKRRRKMMLLLLVGAAAAAVLLYFLFRAANEPTIIVKGNSIDFELVEAEWVQAGQRQWTHDGDESDSEQYIVQLATDGETCGQIPNPVKHIAIKSTGRLRVIMHFTEKKTHIRHPSGELNKQSDKLLKSADGEVVEQIRMWKVGSGQGLPQWECTFSDARKFKQLNVSDH